MKILQDGLEQYANVRGEFELYIYFHKVLT